MSKKRKNAHLPKNAQGLSSEDIRDLRSQMRDAAEKHGEDAVAKQTRFATYTDAFASITNDMRRSDFGSIKNRLKKMEPKKVKTNTANSLYGM